MKAIFYSLVVMVLLFSACQNHHAEEEAHDHSDEEATFQFTAYQSGWELFAEAEPFIKDAASGILTHITDLADFSPLTEGAVTANLIVGTKEIRQTLEKPTRNGIYLFDLQPGVTGTGKLIFEITTPDSTYSITINGVTVFTDEHDAIHAAEEAATENPNAITFTKEQSWKIDFATGTPQMIPFGEVIKTTARIQPAQDEEMILTAQTNGVVNFGRKTLSEGVPVSGGQTLFNLVGAQLADNNMRVRYNEAKNNFKTTKANYERMAKLAEENIVSQKALLEARNTFENARLMFENLQLNFNENGQAVRSPQQGYIRHLYVSNGQYVNAGAPLASITQNRNLFLKAELQHRFAGSLPFIKTATIRSLTDDAVFTLEELNGEIVSFGKNVSDENYLIPVTFKVENRNSFIPGSFVEIYLKAQSEAEVLTVPNSALIEEQGNFSVLFQLSPEKFEKREVKTGSTDGIRTAILSGLNSEDRIVLKGATLVNLAGVSNTLDPHAGHVH
jgi:membrane fusion protein, heavy metal efflux system